MKIRDRLSFQFAIIYAFLLLIVLSGIYFLTNQFRINNFYKRLVDRAYTNADLFLAQDNFSEEKFRDVKNKYPQTLPDEIVRIYNDSDQSVFIKARSFQWSKEVINEVRKRKVIFYTSNGRQTAGIYYIDNSGNFIVIASAIDAYGYQQMRQLLLVMIVTFLISVIIMFFLGRAFARIALSPIIKIIKDVKFIRSASLDKRLETNKGKDEINELTVTFNNLLEHLEQSFEAQRSFVFYASHELRTPVTSIIWNVELTLSAERSREEYKATLESILQESGKLNDVINNLFELAQTNIDVTEFQEIRLDELLWQVKDELTIKMQGSKVDVIYDVPGKAEKHKILGNNYLLCIAFGNVVKNAIKFSDNKAVVCRLYLQDNTTVISIKDSGIGISADDLQNIFQPFFRGKNTFGYPGYGIGLSISEKVFRLHNAQIKIKSELNKGTEFFISFPN